MKGIILTGGSGIRTCQAGLVIPVIVCKHQIKQCIEK